VSNADAAALAALRGALLALLLTASPLRAATPLASKGQPIVEVIAALEARGLTVIYSDELLPGSLTVREAPEATSLVDVLREVLRPHGLTIVRGPRDAWLVVRETQPAPQAPAIVAEPAPPPAAPPVEAAPIETIVVSASYYALAREPGTSAALLTHNQIENLPTLGEDALRATQALPGIATTGVSARSNVRGGLDDETLTRLDRMRIYDPFHFQDFESLFGSIDPAVIDGMLVRTGGYPAPYGDRMSGVIEMTSLTPTELRHELSVSLLNTALFSSGRFDDGRGDWVASLRRSNLDLIIQAADPSIGEPEYFDLFAKLDYALNERWSVAGEALALDDRIQLQDENVALATADYEDAYYWVRFDHTAPNGFEGHYVVSTTRLVEGHAGFLADEGVAFGDLDENRDIRINSLSADWLYHASDRQLLQWGAELRDGDAHYRHEARATFPVPIEFDGTSRTGLDASFDTRVDGQQQALYTSLRSHWARPVTTELGVRWDRQTYTGESQFSPRINLLFDVSQRTRLRAAAGRFHQAQGLEELSISDGVSEFFPAQRAEHYVLSLEHAFDAGVNLKVEGYRKRFDRLRPRFENLYTRLDLLPELHPDRIRIDPQGGEATGLEVTVEQALDGWQWWANLAWSSVEDRIDGRSVPRSWDQPWSLSGGAVWTGARWSVTTTTTWHGGWPATSLALVDDRLVAGDLNDERVGTFQSLDVRARRRFSLPRGEIDFYMEVINAFDHVNPCCLAYDVEVGGAGEVESLELSRETYLPLLPNVGVTWRF
jgi:outer membrane receptor protein involved in Fe transport